MRAMFLRIAALIDDGAAIAATIASRRFEKPPLYGGRLRRRGFERPCASL